MSIKNFDSLFKPRSLALIGASAKPLGIGATALANLLGGGFGGPIWLVNPKYHELSGLRCHAKVSALPQAPELALICTPPATIPGLIRELGARGTKAAIVMTGGLDLPGAGGKNVRQAMLDAAKPHLLRILGPASLGLLAPHIGLNASFAHRGALPGKIAFVSQSGALAGAVLDWAAARGIGFSKFIALGGGADIDFGDLLDYLAGDSETGAILLYMHDLRCARKFMSAARVAAGGKPVIVLRAGREASGAGGAASQTAALADADAVYDAAIRRAGMLRVHSTEELFDAVETLAHAKPQRGKRLAILTNGAGLGVMAVDTLISGGGRLAALSPDTVVQLERVLAPADARANPVDVGDDAPLERYLAALRPLLAEPQSDALLLLHAPTAMASSEALAQAVAPLAQAAGLTVLSCWLGGAAVAPARQVFARAGLPSYDTPEKAVRAFMQIVQYRRNQKLLMEVPAQMPAAPQRALARAIVARALAAGADALDECQSKAVLAAYGIPVVAGGVAADIERALALASEIGYPVALKIRAPGLRHKAEVGGVALDLETPDMLRAAAGAMLGRVGRLRPDLVPGGFTVQAMARRPQAQELIVGVTGDAVFGPVILVGQGGAAVEVTADRALGLPPLNMVLARDMVRRTRVAKLLAGYGGRPPADLEAICRTLIQVAELAADIGELAELDINPLLADADGVLALDARIVLRAGAGADRLAIRPYPQELEQQIEWQGRPLTLRPIRPEDAPQHVEFFNALDPDDVRLRFFTAMRELPPATLARLTQIDYDRAMAFIATRANLDGKPETLGVVRAVADPDNFSAEFAIVVRSDLKGRGLGPILFGKLLEYFRSRGTEELTGDALSQNMGVQHLVKRFGGEVHASSDPGTVCLRLKLQATPL
ncbi:acetyltransferase [Oxalobacteraceae bacterium GrIS 1.11]